MLLSIDVGFKNMAICGLSKNEITLWQIINLTYGNDACTSIISAFDQLHEKIKDATIVIERQMTRKMTNLQCYLEMYFRMKGHSVIIYSPKHKLAGSGKENSGKGLYQARKKASVQLCQEWLTTNPQDAWVMDLWKKTKKKDDISDALMMALAYQAHPIQDITQITKKIIARKPTALQEKRGNYSKSNLKYLLSRIEDRTNLSKKIQTSILKFWPDLTTCLREFNLES